MKIANINDVTQEEIQKYSLGDDEKQEFNSLFLSLKFVLDFYYGEISPETILNFSANSNDGFTSEAAVGVANEVGLIAVEKDIRADSIANYFLPCIIFDKKGEAFVYTKKNTRESFIYNPKTKTEEKLEPSSLKKFKKAILIFRDQKKSELLDLKRDESWFWGPVKSYWRTYVEIGILTIFINIFALTVPLFTMSVYDRVVPNNATETLFVLAFGVFIILIFDIVFKSVRNHIVEKTGKKIGIYFEEELMKRILTVQTQYDTMLTGVKANLFRELNQVKEFFATKSISQVIDFPFFILAVIVIFMISPAVAAVPICVAFFILAFNIIMQIPIASLSKKNLQNTQSKQSFLVELIQGSEIIKLSNAASTKLFNWRGVVAFADTIAMKIQSLNAFSANMSQAVVQFVSMMVIIVGVFEIADKNLTVGGLIAVTILSSRAMVPVIQLSMMAIRFREIKDSLNVINDFWHLPTESNKNIEIGIGKLKGDIEFKKVSFYYKDSKYPSLEKCNLKINAGEKVGIIGQTGAGKSTFLRLLTGLNVPSKGSIFLDGHDTSTLHPVEVRQNIGVMPQEPFLFSGSLKENIELSQPISKEKMMELIKIIGLEDLVKKSGQGDGLQVGERGSNLSVGQRHLVSMARALLKDPSILILDEPTTGLDVGLEKTLVKKVMEIARDKTMIVITHRFAALEMVDRVIVLNEGKIVADGPKDSVLRALQGK